MTALGDQISSKGLSYERRPFGTILPKTTGLCAIDFTRFSSKYTRFHMDEHICVFQVMHSRKCADVAFTTAIARWKKTITRCPATRAWPSGIYLTSQMGIYPLILSYRGMNFIRPAPCGKYKLISPTRYPTRMQCVTQDMYTITSCPGDKMISPIIPTFYDIGTMGKAALSHD